MFTWLVPIEEFFKVPFGECFLDDFDDSHDCVTVPTRTRSWVSCVEKNKSRGKRRKEVRRLPSTGA